jgi:hypothetical protein
MASSMSGGNSSKNIAWRACLNKTRGPFRQRLQKHANHKKF